MDKELRVAIKRAAKEIPRVGHAHMMVDGFVRARGYLISWNLRSQCGNVALPMIFCYGLGLANLCAKSPDPRPLWL